MDSFGKTDTAPLGNISGEKAYARIDLGIK
jgi:hypothetical protein